LFFNGFCGRFKNLKKLFMNKNMTKSTKIFIRTQKALIRLKFWDVKKQKEEIEKLYNNLKIKVNVTVTLSCMLLLHYHSF